MTTMTQSNTTYNYQNGGTTGSYTYQSDVRNTSYNYQSQYPPQGQYPPQFPPQNQFPPQGQFPPPQFPPRGQYPPQYGYTDPNMTGGYNQYNYYETTRTSTTGYPDQGYSVYQTNVYQQPPVITERVFTTPVFREGFKFKSFKSFKDDRW